MELEVQCRFNLLKSTGYVMHQQFNIQQFYALPILHLCNIYAVQQDTQSFFNDWDYSSHMLARHVSDHTGPSSGAFYKLYL